MEPVREKWTDERLDDLNHMVGGGFQETRDEARALRSEMVEEFRALRSEIDLRFDRMDQRFESMQRVMVQSFIATSAAMLAGFGGLAALVATRL